MQIEYRKIIYSFEALLIFLKNPSKTKTQTISIHKEREISKKEIKLSAIPVPSRPPAIGIIFPKPVTAAISTASMFVNVQLYAHRFV